MVDPDGALAQLLDLIDVVADKQQRCAAGEHLLHPLVALLLEHKVTDGQNLVAGQNVGPDLCRNREAQPRDHAAGIVFYRHIDKIPQFGKVDDVLEVLLHVGAVMAEHRTVQKDVLPRGQVQVKARAQLDQGRDLAVDGHAARRGVHNAGNQLQHRALAAAVAADECDGLAGLNFERNVPQCVKFVEKQLMLQQLDGVFLEGLGFLLREVETHRDVLHLNDGHEGKLLTDTE